MFYLLLLTTLFKIKSDVIFPPKVMKIQWQQEGLLRQCNNATLIVPALNCNNDPDGIYECYYLTSDGICTQLTNNTAKKLQIEGEFVTAIAPSTTGITVLNNNKSIATFNIDSKYPQFSQVINLKNSLNQLGLVQSNGNSLYLKDFLILNTLGIQNCNDTDQTPPCKICNSGYDLQEGKCVLTKCTEEVASIKKLAISSFIDIEDQTIIVKFNGQFSDCVNAYMYLVNRIEERKPTKYVPKKHLEYDMNTTLQLKIAFDDLLKQWSCQLFSTLKEQVRQCTIQLAFTYNGKVENLYLFQFNTNLANKSAIQGFNLAIGENKLSVILLSETKVLNQAVVNKTLTLEITHLVLDTSYSLFEIEFGSATLQLGNAAVNLNLLSAQKGTSSITYKLSGVLTQDTVAGATLTLKSTLKQPPSGSSFNASLSLRTTTFEYELISVIDDLSLAAQEGIANGNTGTEESEENDADVEVSDSSSVSPQTYFWIYCGIVIFGGIIGTTIHVRRINRAEQYSSQNGGQAMQH